MYNSDLVNEFHRALFLTDYEDYATATQNAKTDELFDFDNFEDWFDNLIDVFIEDIEDIEIEKEALLKEIEKCPDFVADMRSEYYDLLELLKFEDDD
jgi:hypothetical protein